MSRRLNDMKPSTFDELKQQIKSCKTTEQLDAMRLPLVRFPQNGGTVEEFYKLQKIFITQKNKIARHTA